MSSFIVPYQYELYHNGEKVGETPFLSEAKAFADERPNNAYSETSVFVGPVKEIDAVPDASLIHKDMCDYGYNHEQMLPVSGNKAMKLFDDDVPLYQLYNDNTESLVEERKDVEQHISKGGMFGVEKPDWERHIKYMAVQNEIKQNEPLLEEKLLRPAEQFSDKESNTMVGIYQLNDGNENHYRRFASLSEISEQPNRENYTLVYTYPVSESVVDIKMLREEVFEKFNVALPEDFKGHSLSVSDVVAINQNGNITAHYCDKVGFIELEQFGQIKKPVVTEQEKPAKKAKKQCEEKQYTSLASIKKVAEDIKKNSSQDEIKQKGRIENAIAE